MLYLSIDHNIVTPRGLSVTPGGGLAIARPLGFSAICWSGGLGTAGTVADTHPVIPHVRVNGIILVLRNRYFGAMAQYCFSNLSLETIFSSFCVYRTTFQSPWCSLYLGFTVDFNKAPELSDKVGISCGSFPQ